jgi:REP element-mobilizing transposase RayT
MVVAYHLIITAYGFWLPNDPRGSWSDFVGAWELLRFGAATKTDSRRSVAARPHDHRRRLEAKEALKYPEVHFTGVQARQIGMSFYDWARQRGATIWACSILPEHVHLVVARYRYQIEQVANLLKGASTRALAAAGLHPLARFAGAKQPPKMWARNEWKVFLDDTADIRRAIRYVEQNPVKEGKPEQHWQCVTEFDGATERFPSGRG